MIKRYCKNCGKKFFTKLYCIKNGDGKYCSKKCYHKSTIGRKHSQLAKERMSKSRTGKNNWNFGKHLSEKTKKILSDKAKIQCKGSGNPRWKGGKRKDGFGYIYIYKPKHPFPTTANYIYEHRLVMEKHLKRYLKPGEVIHHINGNPSDNRIKNLILFKNNGEHIKLHYPHGFNPKRKIK